MASAMIPGVERFLNGEDFQRWLHSVEMYFEALEITSDGRKRAMLLHLVGPDLQQVYETLSEPAGVQGQFDICKAKLKMYFAPARNTISEWLTFQSVRVAAGEQFGTYVARLRNAANRCGFPAASLDQEICNQCMAGTSGKLHERLLRRAAEQGDALTLREVTAVADGTERTQVLLDQMRGPGLSPAGTGPGHPASLLPVREARTLGRGNAPFMPTQASLGVSLCAPGVVNQGTRRTVQCPRRRAPGRSGRDLQCYQCGQLGHIRRAV